MPAKISTWSQYDMCIRWCPVVFDVHSLFYWWWLHEVRFGIAECHELHGIVDTCDNCAVSGYFAARIYRGISCIT